MVSMVNIRNYVDAIRSDWRDFTSAALAITVSILCLAAALYRMIHNDERLVPVLLCVLALGPAVFGMRLALRKLAEIDRR